jgi:AraC family transcriptional regulator, regulatory protein of adaptative response / DNA-3-methyladenine glycosylase II
VPGRAGVRACGRPYLWTVSTRTPLTLRLAADEPYDAASLLAFFAVRAIPGVEEAADGRYRRHLALPHGDAVVELAAERGGVAVALTGADERDVPAAVERVRHLCDLAADADAIASVLGADPALAPLVDARPGLRVPGFADGWELAARAVLGQQVSVAAARTLAARLVERLGAPLERPSGGVTHRFPAPEAVRDAPDELFAMPRSRIETLRRVAALAAERDPTADALAALRGIGPWTAGYVAMRRGDPDVFLPTDAGVLRALRALGGAPDPERWRPWRSYAVMHLWAAL